MVNSHEVRLSSSVQNLPFGLKRIFPRNEISFLHFRFLRKKALSNSHLHNLFAFHAIHMPHEHPEALERILPGKPTRCQKANTRGGISKSDEALVPR